LFNREGKTLKKEGMEVNKLSIGPLGIELGLDLPSPFCRAQP